MTLKRYFSGMFAVLLILHAFPSPAEAKKAAWVANRPVDMRYYIGIGSSEKKAHKDDYRLVAENEALFDLSSAISVDISGAFMEKTMERTGLSEQNIRLEIQATSRTRLTGHEMVDEWEDWNSYWVYFRLSKDAYIEMRRKEREAARAASLDMLRKAITEKEKGHAVSALRFYFEALSRIQHFIGENVKANLDGGEVFLYNEIYAGIQRTLAEISLTADRDRMPLLCGHPLEDPLTVRGTARGEGGQAVGIAHLPVHYTTPWRDEKIACQATTDENGYARCVLSGVSDRDHGKTVKAKMDVTALSAQVEPGVFFNAVLDKVDIPEATFSLNVYNDETTYKWRREFEGRRVLVLSAYSAGNTSNFWKKIQDEVTGFIREAGGVVVAAETVLDGTPMDPARIVSLSEHQGGAWRFTSPQSVDLVLVMAASGRLNRRENSANPFGEDVQFAGEIRTLAQKHGRPRFNDRYRGAGGWNPMGEEMAMDVLALHVFNRWQVKYFQSLGALP